MTSLCHSKTYIVKPYLGYHICAKFNALNLPGGYKKACPILALFLFLCLFISCCLMLLLLNIIVVGGGAFYLSAPPFPDTRLK